MTRLQVTICAVFFSISNLYAQQELSNFRSKKIPVNRDTVRIDSNSIYPNSLKIKGIDSLTYAVDAVSAMLIWKHKPPVDSVTIAYRILPFSLASGFQKYSFDSIANRFSLPQSRFISAPGLIKPLDFGKIQSSGSLARSFALGNRQDAVFNSNLNLQLNGYLGDSILLNAAITDNNIPIQPDGNTQNLNEFDKVFISLSKEKWKLSVGDLDLRKDELYYLNFYKRLQGFYFDFQHNASKNISNTLTVSGAVAKGKFTRNVFQGIEGNQGPYRLKGANGELFFIVLAGTERVFIDGVMLQRGEDQDYVINYNTAEVTFMPKQMITKDKRIQIEFEWADRNYLNIQRFLQDQVKISRKLDITIGYFANDDIKTSPVNQDLTNGQKQFLSSSGSVPGGYFYPSAMTDTVLGDKIRYRKVDTLLQTGQRDTVYVYSNLPETGLYSVSFSDVGEGNGDYVLDPSTIANGKVFKWIQRLPNGARQGKYAPLVLLVPPRKQSLLSLGTHWEITPKTKMAADFAMSTLNPNAFAISRAQIQQGGAAKINLSHVNMLSKNTDWKISSNLNMEFVSDGFRPLERLRSVEFTRDWGLDILPQNDKERIVSGELQVSKKDDHSIGYNIGNYARGTDFQAVRQSLIHRFSNNGWHLDNDFTLTTFKKTLGKGYYLRPNLNVSKQVKDWGNREFSVRYALERNLLLRNGSDSVAPSSFEFSTFRLSTSSDPSRQNKWGFGYFTRTDLMPYDGLLGKTDKSNNLNINGEWMSNDHHQLRMNVTYRKLVVSKGEQIQAPETFLGRVEYFSNFWKNGIVWTSLYETGSGQEPKRDFTYFEVPPGQGEYAWIDYNQDGVKQLNEFETAVFKDQAKFIRIYTPTSSFVRANYLQSNYNLIINPSLPLSGSESASIANKFLSRLYLQSSMQMARKELATGSGIIQPLKGFESDSALITYDGTFSQSLSYNKFSSKWGFDFNWLRSANKGFQSFGFESRQFEDMSIKLRTTWFKEITVEMLYRQKENLLNAPGISNRNYDIHSKSLEPRLTFTKGTDFRSNISYRYESKLGNEVEKAIVHAIQFEVNYNWVSNLSIHPKFGFNDISYGGQSNNSLGYVMLEGLQKGRNILWSLDLNRRLSKSIELGVQYEGRKTQNGPIVHLGRAQIRALL